MKVHYPNQAIALLIKRVEGRVAEWFEKREKLRSEIDQMKREIAESFFLVRIFSDTSKIEKKVFESRFMNSEISGLKTLLARLKEAKDSNASVSLNESDYRLIFKEPK